MVMYDSEDVDDADYHVIFIGSNSGANSYRRKFEAGVNADGGTTIFLTISRDICRY
jgi:formyltetrahydrofolate hydrolase